MTPPHKKTDAPLFAKSGALFAPFFIFGRRGKSRTALPGKNRTALPGKNRTALPGKSRTALPGKSRTALPGKSRAGTLGEKKGYHSPFFRLRIRR